MASIAYTPTPKLIDLLQKADPSKTMCVRIEDNHTLALGIDPLKPTVMIDLSNESLTTQPVSSKIVPAPPMTRTSRYDGDYWFEVKGERGQCKSLKDLLHKSLTSIEAVAPGTLDKLSNIKLRSKRIVAREKSKLFDRAHLAIKYSEKIPNGWWMGTNNSSQETNAWLERACSCAGLTWGENFKTSLM